MTTNQTSLSRESDTSGQILNLQKGAPPIYAVRSEFRPEIYIDISNYGWFPEGRTRITRIMYVTEEATPVYVAGFISAAPVNLSSFFSQSEFRIGVRTSLTKESLQARIDAANELIEQDKNDKIDKSFFDKSTLKANAIKNLEFKINVLNEALTKLQGIIDKGWTHFVIASAWKEGMIDRLDLNLDYFETFYPKEAFPIAGIINGKPSWVNRDYFLWEFFPKGVSVPSKDGNIILWNCFDYLIESDEKLNNLIITFNHSVIDVINENEGRVQKLVVKKKWPTVKEVLGDIIDDLKKHPYGKEADKKRREALQWAGRFQRRAMQLRKRKKDKFADENEGAANGIIDGLGESLSQEQEKLISDLNGIEDPLDKEADLIAKRCFNNLGNLMSIGSKGGEELSNRTFWAVVSWLKDRAELQLDQLRKADINDPKFDSKIISSFKTLSNLMELPDELDPKSKKNKRKNDEIMSDMTRVIVNHLNQKAELELDELKNFKSDQKGFSDKASRIMNTLARIQMLGEETNPTSKKRKSLEILNETKIILSKRISDQIKDIAESNVKWDAVKLSNLIKQNRLLDETYNPDIGTLKKLRIKSFDEIERVYLKNPSMNENLKKLISTHVIILKDKLPEILYKDPKVNEYLNQIQIPVSEEDKLGDKSLNVDQIPEKSDKNKV